MVIKVDGKKTVVQPNKTGYIHYLDPKTGAFIKATPFADKIDWIKGYDKDGRPISQIALPKEGGDPVTMWPSLLGGVNMYPNAYNPQTGNLYLAATNSGMKYGLEEIKVISNVRHFGAYQEFIFGNEIDKAVNVSTGAEVWRNELAKPGYAGGMLTTAGGLTIWTTQGGGFTVANAKTGEVLYSHEPGHGCQVGPSHLHRQRQAVHRAGVGRHAGLRPRRGMECRVRKHGRRVHARLMATSSFSRQ